MLETIAAYIEQHHLLPSSGEVIVAVSGGADSLCLLHVLHQLCGPGKRYPELRLHGAHLNHKLRGEASSQDALAVAQIVAAWGLPLTIGEVDVPALARQEQRSLEDAARMARYRFLREVAQGQPIAVAHHADDQVETLLLHWLRGGGVAGMVGMLPRQQDIIRPLLTINHAQTVAYCQRHAIVPLEDASNADPRFLRNRIRHELLPLLESLNPGIRSTLIRNAEVIRVDVEWIDAQVNACWPDVVISEQDDAIRLSLNALLALPLSLQRHLLRRVTAQLCAGQSPLELRHYLLIEQLFSTGAIMQINKIFRSPVGADLSRPPPIYRPSVHFPVPDYFVKSHNRASTFTLHLPCQLRVTCNFNEIMFDRLSRERANFVFSSSDTEILLPIPGSIEVPGTPWTATAETLPGELAQEVRQALCREDWSEVWRLLPSTRHAVYVDGDVVSSFVWVRTRRPGDRIQPLGMAHEKKVQDVLVDKHIPRADRAHIPLFFSTSHCIWLAGVCLDERARLTNKTERIVLLSISH